jgi:hypothetical protein
VPWRRDRLRDEGINFYGLLFAAGVPARCRQMMGTMLHGTEIFSIAGPDLSRDTAATSPDSYVKRSPGAAPAQVGVAVSRPGAATSGTACRC